MSKAQMLGISYDVWKTVVQNNGFTAYFHEDDGVSDQGSAFAGTDQYIYATRIVDDTWADFDGYFPNGTRIDVARRDDAIANIVGLSGISSRTITTDGVLRVSTEKPEGTRKTFVSPDWGDCTTWYWKSTKLDGYQLDAYDDGYKIYKGYDCWIDNFHGKYFDEDVITNEAGDIPRLKVYVDGYEKTEQDPQYLIDPLLSLKGDYVVDYKKAKVTFHDALSSSSVVTVDAWLHGSSEWVIKPDAGKKLKLESAEVQFGKSISLKDQVSFQVWVYNPYDLPNKVPYGNPAVYKNMKDFINEANGALPAIPASSNTTPTWRDLDDDVVTYPWNYQAITELKSSVGAEIRIRLTHDKQFDGFATATFYCRVFDDS